MRAHRWGAGLALVLAAACVAAATPTREFEPRHFTGLTAKVIKSDEDATLDIDFDRVGGGLLRFAHCRELKADLLAQVLPSQAALADILRLNCLAVHRYAGSAVARHSHLPARWSASAVGQMPAQLLPKLGPAGPAETAAGPDGSLAQRLGPRQIAQMADGAVRVTGAEVVAQIHRQARADFDGDGNEDWLLRIDWAARQGDARGSELVLVARPVAGAPLRVAERLTP
jgi:hypothetical protein